MFRCYVEVLREETLLKDKPSAYETSSAEACFRLRVENKKVIVQQSLKQVINKSHNCHCHKWGGPDIKII